MKRNKRFNIFGWLSAAVLLLTPACTGSTDFNEVDNTGEAGTVTLNLSIQNQGVMTRAGEADGSSETLSHISDGSQVNVLIFAIYESDTEAGTYTINGTKFNSTKLKVTSGYTIEDVAGNSGQMKIAFKPNTLTRPGNAAAITLKIPVEDGKYYKIACWAQSDKCSAYTTTDLKEVKVNYEGAQNNDEARDAFCACEPFASNSSSISVILKRPFAQINVGTAGWDYEGVAELKPSAISYTQSKITLKGVASTYNVLEGKAIQTEEDKTKEVVFAYNRLPAFINVTSVTDGKYNYKPYPNEEYLIIDLDEKDGIEKYWGWTAYKTWSIDHQDIDEGAYFTTEGSPYLTETFKYLSMCYVLVPEARDENIKEDVTYCATLDEVKFETKGYDEDGKESDDYQAFTASNVPVQKNWRTNIVSFEMFTARTGFKLWVVPEYCGDYNSFDSGETWENEKEGVENGNFNGMNWEYGWKYFGNDKDKKPSSSDN